MRIVASDEIEAVLTYRELIETLLRAYRSQTNVPEPTRYGIDRPDTASGHLKVAPAWTNFMAQGHTERGYVGCTLSVSLPAAKNGENSSGTAPSESSGIYLLMSGSTGHPIALFDGSSVAIWRQCAQHALAAQYLAREDTSRLLFCGSTPALERILEAYGCVRDIRSVLFIGDHGRLCDQLSASSAFPRIQFGWTHDLAEAVAGADMISCIGNAASVLSGVEIASGTHIDVIDAGVLPEAVRGEARLFISDRRDSAAADLTDIAADLSELAQGQKAGRRYYDQITLFAGGDSTGLADLATAGHIFLRA